MLKQIQNRRSIRKYLNKKVEKEKLVQILESARLALSGSNTQPWTFIMAPPGSNGIFINRSGHVETVALMSRRRNKRRVKNTIIKR